jgi:hypothetical protein
MSKPSPSDAVGVVATTGDAVGEAAEDATTTLRLAVAEVVGLLLTATVGVTIGARDSSGRARPTIAAAATMGLPVAAADS